MRHGYSRSPYATTRDNYRGTSNTSRNRYGNNRSIYANTRNNYRGRNTSNLTQSNHRNINALNPNSIVNSQKAPSTGIKKEPKMIQKQSTSKQKISTSTSTKAKTTTSKTRYTTITSQKPQQLMRSVQKSTTRGRVQHPTNSIERMLGEYSQAYKKPKKLQKTNAKQNIENLHKATQPKKQIPTKKEEVQQFKKGIANTKNTNKDIAYREYERSQYRRDAMQRRMKNNRYNREEKGR